MHRVEPEYAQDDIAIDLSFENAEFVNEDSEDECKESDALPLSTSSVIKNALQELKDELAKLAPNHGLLESVAAISDYLVDLEGKVRDLTVQNAMQTIDLHSTRQLYRASVEENEKLATRMATPLPTKESTRQADVTTSQLQEYMELDLEMNQAKADKDKLQSENERIATMCAQFQQEILWRNIDVAEGEKRCLAMAHQLRGTKQLYDESQRENAELKTRVESMAHQNQTLLQHKKLLVNEVKSLQKYSHVNIAGLEQDAQEARMMQKSLSAQLDRAHAERDELKAKLNAHSVTSG